MDRERISKALVSLRVAAVSAAVLYGAYYLVWRVVAGTVDLRAWYLGFALLIVEVFALYQLTLALMRIRTDRHLALTDDELHRAFAACSLERECVTVDVMIPTYDEPLEVLLQTIRAARDIEYPHETYVLDDGDRDWLSECCMSEHVHYVTRENREHFKAGNINHALTVSSGDFVVVLDADFIALPNLIGAFLPYFDDERMAVVQAPQAFYNTDSFQHSRHGKWNDQTHFFRTVLPAKAKVNSAFWCGTPAMLRRSAIESIGGVSTRSITEDIETSIVLQSQGWVIGYHNQTLALGLAPNNIEGFMTQRIRWGRGALQILGDRRFNPLTVPGLSLRQRFEYLESMTFWFQGWLFSLEYLIPPVVLFTALSPISHTIAPQAFLVRWGIFAAGMIVASYLAAPRTFRLLDASMYRPLYAMIHISVGINALRREQPSFKVTSKELNAKSLYAPFLVAMYSGVALMVGALVYRVLRQSQVIPGPQQTSFMFLLAGAFALYYSVVFLMLARRITKAANEHRRYYRRSFDTWAPARIEWEGGIVPVDVRNLSIQGALLGGEPEELYEAALSGQGADMVLELPEGEIEAKVTFQDVTSSPGEMFVGVEFTEIDEAGSRALNEYLMRSLMLEESSYDDEPAVSLA